MTCGLRKEIIRTQGDKLSWPDQVNQVFYSPGLWCKWKPREGEGDLSIPGKTTLQSLPWSYLLLCLPPAPGTREMTTTTTTTPYPNTRKQITLATHRVSFKWLWESCAHVFACLKPTHLVTGGKEEGDRNSGHHDTRWTAWAALLLISALCCFLDPTVMHVFYYSVDLSCTEGWEKAGEAIIM